MSARPNLPYRLPRQEASKQQNRHVDDARIGGRIIGKCRDACHGMTMTAAALQVEVGQSEMSEETTAACSPLCIP